MLAYCQKYGDTLFEGLCISHDMSTVMNMKESVSEMLTSVKYLDVFVMTT